MAPAGCDVLVAQSFLVRHQDDARPLSDILRRGMPSLKTFQLGSLHGCEVDSIEGSRGHRMSLIGKLNNHQLKAGGLEIGGLNPRLKEKVAESR